MKLKVSKDYISFINLALIHSGEYHANECEFVFDAEYEDLIKVAVFTNGELTYKVMIDNNKCFIPWEVLINKGLLKIGVYGYYVDRYEQLRIRYSPTPATIEINEGSFEENAINSQPLTPTDKEVIFQELNNIDLKTINVLGGVEIEMTNPKGETTISMIYNGKNGKDGSDYVITEEDYQAIADVVEGQITIPTKTSQLQNDSNFVTNTDYATTNNAGVIKVSANLGTTQSTGTLQGSTRTLEQYNSASNGLIICKGTLENVITGKGLVSNTDYATSDTGGVIRAGNNIYLSTSGRLNSNTSDYNSYLSQSNGTLIGKGTLENVIEGKRINTSYSTTETVVGTFLNKTLYRKVISLTKDEYNSLSIGSNNRRLLDVSNLNIDNLVNAILCCNYSDVDGFHNKTSYMHRTDTNGYELGCHEIKAGLLNFFIGNSILTALAGKANIILEYTKTTD